MMNQRYVLLFSCCRFHNRSKEKVKVLISLVISMLEEHTVLLKRKFLRPIVDFYIFYFFSFSLLRTSPWNLEAPVQRKMIHQVRQISITHSYCALVLLCKSVWWECNHGKF